MSTTTFVCSCEDTMPLDGRAVARGCKGEMRSAEQLCGAQLDRFLAALGEGRPVTVACTAQAPLFEQEAEEAGFAAPLAFVNIRETAGWSDEAKAAGPKMAALIAAAAVPMPATPLVPLKSEGVTLVLGRDAAALDAARRLAATLDVTVLLTGAESVEPLRSAEFPVARGRARAATGWLGTFEVTVDGYAMPRPSSRAAYAWGPAKDGATSRCDVILDLTGGAPLFPTHELRQGYLRADPADAAAVERAVAAARDLVGEFDKPRFVTFEASLCAHSRNRRTGCTRCLDLCPTGAITPGKDSVVVSAEICAGCGACAAVCPTGAASYALPSSEALLRRLRTLLLTYREAGGETPLVLVHDAHGEALIEALARHGDGLPARVLPLRVNEVSQLDLATLLSAFAWGAAQLRLLMKAKRAHGTEGVFRNLDYVQHVLAGLGIPDHGAPRAAAIETDDPFALGEALRALPRRGLPFPPSTHLAMGASREVLRQAARALAEGAGR
ncbi:4Fe-4S binding protein, partial [Falsiroseomonas oryzae]|uniref:4Fe-4S binding protein n=1 Tax=Falsiroseomonas oryzae TaxID=2766473 RepID=UPI0022EB5E08